MERIHVESRVGPDGVLRVEIPIGIDEADLEVRVWIEPLPSSASMNDERPDWLTSMAGSIDDPTFHRYDQGEFEIREPLP